MSTNTDRVMASTLPPAAPDEHHRVCCVNAHVTLCDCSAEHLAWNPVALTSCVVCADLDESDFCPVFGTCP